MGRITDANGYDALDVLTELCEPLDEITKDSAVAKFIDGGKFTMMGFIKLILESHKEAAVKIMAIDDGKTVEEELGVISTLTLPVRLIRIFNNDSIKELFFGSAATGRPATGLSAASGSGNG